MTRIQSIKNIAIYAILFLLAVITYAAFHEHSIFLDCDSPWHIAAGDMIRSLGAVPYGDSWSFTTGDARWYNLSWLYDVAVSWLHQHYGLSGLVVMNILMAALIPCVLARICLLRGYGLLPTLVACIIALIMLKACFSIRPQQTSMLVMSLVLLCLTHHRLAPGRLIWCVPLLACLWANIHGSYLVLATMLGAFWLEAAWPVLARGATSNQRRAALAKGMPYIYVGLASLAAVLINPLWQEIFYASWLSLGSEYSQNYISEWQPAQLGKTPQVFVYVLLMLALPLAARMRVPLSDSVLAIFWLVMALNSARHNVVLAVVVTPMLAMLLHELFGRSVGRLKRMEAAMQRDFAQPITAIMLVLFAAASAVFLLVPALRHLVIAPDLYDASRYPVEEIRYLKVWHPGSNILNTYCYGGYLIYQAGGELRPMMDSRIDTVYPEKSKVDYFDILTFQPHWRDVVAEYDVSLALFPNDDQAAADAFSRAGWRVEHQGEVATIYTKVTDEKDSE